MAWVGVAPNGTLMAGLRLWFTVARTSGSTRLTA